MANNSAEAAAIYLDDPARYLGEVVTASRAVVRDRRLRLDAVEELNDLLAAYSIRIKQRDVPALTAPERARLLSTLESAKRELNNAEEWQTAERMAERGAQS